MENQYPIGTFQAKGPYTKQNLLLWMQEMIRTVEQLEKMIQGWTDDQYAEPYREQGWTVQQVIHHIADAQINDYFRIKLALTETEPTIKPYDEAAWSELAEVRASKPEISITLTKSLQQRMLAVLQSLEKEQITNVFRHPERGPITIVEYVEFCAWHIRHHAEQIRFLAVKKGWM